MTREVNLQKRIIGNGPPQAPRLVGSGALLVYVKLA